LRIDKLKLKIENLCVKEKETLEIGEDDDGDLIGNKGWRKGERWFGFVVLCFKKTRFN